ncbi:MAG: hypothetical protein HOD37_10510 [Bacteroidetes bacterium]|mgnify:CR=1 FL=1|nr:hypothetical protein [Bacteroidota bacterium]
MFAADNGSSAEDAEKNIHKGNTVADGFPLDKMHTIEYWASLGKTGRMYLTRLSCQTKAVVAKGEFAPHSLLIGQKASLSLAQSIKIYWTFY